MRPVRKIYHYTDKGTERTIGWSQVGDLIVSTTKLQSPFVYPYETMVFQADKESPGDVYCFIDLYVHTYDELADAYAGHQKICNWLASQDDDFYEELMESAY